MKVKLKSQSKDGIFYFCSYDCKKKDLTTKRTKAEIIDFRKNEKILKNPFRRLYVDIINLKYTLFRLLCYELFSRCFGDLRE